MWILTPLQPGGETHYLVGKKEFVVGRKNCDILLANDQSISRAHAHLTLTGQTLTLKDSSKYGTSVNAKRLAENTSVNLKSGDNVTFGAFNSKFIVDRHQTPAVCSSCLDNPGKASLSQTLLAVEGKLVNTWTEDCTHLVMPTVKVTVKTICALLCGRPVVKPEFFLELSKAVQQKAAPPKAESFIPEIDEPSLMNEELNLGVVTARKQLFAEKTFVFLSGKQMKRLSAAVTFGGGSSRLLEEGSLPRHLLESPQSCVLDVATGSSQSLLSSAATEWSLAIKDIVHSNGLRVITESEIGLAAIFASCDKYCNPSGLQPESESAPKMKPRIPSASLSQSVAVDETVLPAPSQNITAYVMNTEAVESSSRCDITGVMSVGETPEKKQVSAEKASSPVVVAETMSSSFNVGEHMNSPWKKPESKTTGAGSSGRRAQSSTSWTNGGTNKFQPKWSPQKSQPPSQVSPQKQSTLTSFFKPANKKRPLEDEFSDVMSEPKRPTLAPDSTVTPKQTSSPSDRLDASTSQTDLFAGRTEESGSLASWEEPRIRKRKEMAEEIQLAELESIMSQDVDFFDEPPPTSQSLPGKHEVKTVRKQDFDMEEPSSSSKRPRVHVGEGEENRWPLENKAHKKQNQQQEQFTVEKEKVDTSENTAINSESGKPPAVPSTSRRTQIQPFDDDDDDINDLELVNAGNLEVKEETKTPTKAVPVKQELKEESKFDENLPKKLILVEFRSLTVSAPPKTKPLKTLSNGFAKNFKSFRKSRVPGVESSPAVIRGPDLLVHCRGKNSDLDEWLKDAAEEERQSQRDKSAGDDLFRYNPSKLPRRR